METLGQGSVMQALETSSTRPLLNVDIRAGYGKTVVLDELRFSVQPGENLGLVGVSGAGKSTVLLAVLGLLQSKRGWLTGGVQLEGQELTALSQSQFRKLRGRAVALIPQSPMSALSPVLRLSTHFREVWLAHEPENADKRLARTREVLDCVHLPSNDAFLDRHCSEISVGQAQRVLIALALLHRPRLIIADEPTSALDPVSRMEVLQLLGSLTGAGRVSLLYVSHDILSVLKLSTRVAVLDRGRVVENVPVRDLPDSRCAATRHLLGSLPVPIDVLMRSEGFGKQEETGQQSETPASLQASSVDLFVGPAAQR